ncbi:hypothetical protein HNR16_002243 [Pseudoclavibacter chungangensis]|nr:hypothetical protein [Pseudoclavibacter chungangensis]NYJ67455.1 hypothetical protein [Pseudoclavibacter chungangensis]
MHVRVGRAGRDADDPNASRRELEASPVLSVSVPAVAAASCTHSPRAGRRQPDETFTSAPVGQDVRDTSGDEHR